MRPRHLSAAAIAATLLALTATAGTAQADHRKADDPCTGAQTHFERGTYSGQGRQCNAVFEIPPHRTWADPISYQDGKCPGGGYMVNEGAWDFWAYRGEWVTWSLTFREAPHLGSNDENLSRRTYFVAPFYHNWSSWNWPTRTVEYCHDVPKLAALSVADTDAADGQDIHLGARDDVDHGTAQADDIEGGKGDDDLFGGRGDDTLLGGQGQDHLYGGAGDDQLFDDHGEDLISAGAGNDRISTKDGNHDVVDCGAGEDIAIGDPHDTFRHCEHVYTTPENTPAHPPTIS
jgi:hypothetical protein